MPVARQCVPGRGRPGGKGAVHPSRAGPAGAGGSGRNGAGPAARIAAPPRPVSPAGVAVWRWCGQRPKKKPRLNEFWIRVRVEVVVVFPELVFVTVEVVTLLQLRAWVWTVTGMSTPRMTPVPPRVWVTVPADWETLQVLVTCAGAAGAAEASGVIASIPPATTPRTMPAFFSTVSPDEFTDLPRGVRSGVGARSLG